MSEEDDGVKGEFIAEAQEIIESLSRDLLVLDHGQKEGHPDPDLVNSVFRGVHTLKGIAGMFGFGELGDVAHVLEDLLDQLRLGRVDLTQEVLDVLFEGVEVLQRLLSAGRGGGTDAPDVDVDAFRGAVHRVLSPASSAPSELGSYGLDTGVLSVLTEYEEHRLRTNIEQGVPLYRLRVRFGLASIDSDLEELKARAKPIAEIITYLPSMEGGDDDAIDLEVLLASRASIEELRETLVTEADAVLEALARKSEKEKGRTVPPPPAVPASAVSVQSATPAPVKSRTQAPPVQPKDAGADALSVKGVAKTVRVDIAKLDHLMNVVGELAIVRSAVAKISEGLRANPELRKMALELHRIHRQFERHLDDLQDGILDVRMVPLGQTFDRLARAVRQVARDHGKEVRLVVSGADTEVDKLIVEELTDPLLHIIRNAVDHGIERADERTRIGKPATGTLALNAYQKGNHVVIEIEDDGAGMDEHRIVAASINRGTISAEAGAEMGRAEKLALIFLPGVSTAETVSELSGRGVGMDVVKTHISRLGGVVDVQSQLEIGTKFTITLPITLAIISALVIRVMGRTFAVPLTVVQEAVLLDPKAVRRVEGHEVITLRGGTLPICRLDKFFNLEVREPHVGKEYVVVTALGQRRLGLVVQTLEGQQDIIIKALGASLNDIKGFAGATDLGDQRVALVLDASTLLEEVLTGPERRAAIAGVLQ